MQAAAPLCGNRNTISGFALRLSGAKPHQFFLSNLFRAADARQRDVCGGNCIQPFAGGAAVAQSSSGARRICRAAVVCFLLLFLAVPVNPAAAETYADRGGASWYGTSAHGKQTANGEVYNRNALTAAHKQLPFGTIIRVHNLKNGKQVLVRVNDRGPFVNGRVVDLSQKAAQILGMTKSGVVPVRLEVISGKKGASLLTGQAFYVHISNERSAFNARGKAAKLSKEMKEHVKILYRANEPGKGFALCLGPFTNFKDAHRRFMKLGDNNQARIKVIEVNANEETLYCTTESPFSYGGGLYREQMTKNNAVFLKVLAPSWHPALLAVQLITLGNADFLLADL